MAEIEPSTDAASALERSRAQAKRYELSVMRLGCLTTSVWISAGILVFTELVEVVIELGLPTWMGMLAGAAGVVGVRGLTLLGYRGIRDRLRARRLVALRSSPEAADLGHLSAPLVEVVTELRELLRAVQSLDGDPAVTIEALRRWLTRLSELEPEQQQRLRDLGLDASSLYVVARIRREPGELTDFWNERAYRRLHSALPVLSHFERQLLRGRDDVYR